MDQQRTAPRLYQEYLDFWNDPAHREASLAAYARGAQSFIPHLLPELAVQLPAAQTIQILRARFGDDLDRALDPDSRTPSPVTDQPNGNWLKTTNLVGVNVRTVGSFWNLVQYALTLPAAQNAIHILPIWEPGVAGSMYGLSSWQLNPEFFSLELAEAIPVLDTLEKQLRVAVNLLHLMGKTVGMDVIPHTDRFSQIVLAFPEHFEWLIRQDTEIVDQRVDLHTEAQKRIQQWLTAHGPALEGDALPENLFSPEVDEPTRNRLLFGLPENPEGRAARRNLVIQQLYRYGLEPVPATMAPPFRGLAVDTRPDARNVDSRGQIWRDYRITRPEPMSRVFGPLTRFKLYERLDDNADWQIDFSRPRPATWDYLCQHYAAVQQQFGFDFMRGDMSHVQMRPDGVPATLDRYYDPLGTVKTHIREQGAPYFGYFAETFLAPRDVMGYGEEIDHLEASQAEATLGDLQSTVVGSPEFLQNLRYYADLLTTRRCAPSFTVLTADKDDPRFDHFYQGGSLLRLFFALFLSGMPSYMALGFECREAHFSPAPNEHYTKLYVFQESDGPKATRGPYVWGRNACLFSEITRLRQFADELWPQIAARPIRWLIPPDARAHSGVMAWTLQDRVDFVFMANTSLEKDSGAFGLPLPFTQKQHLASQLIPLLSTHPGPAAESAPIFNGQHYRVQNLAPAEGRVYEVGR